MTPEKDDRLLVSVKEAARLLGIGRTKIYELMATGDLETKMVGRRRMVRYKSLAAFSKNN